MSYLLVLSFDLVTSLISCIYICIYWDDVRSSSIIFNYKKHFDQLVSVDATLVN